MAIMEYLGRKHGLWPETEEGLTDASVLREVAVDLVWMTINYIYFPQHRAKVKHIAGSMLILKLKFMLLREQILL